MPQSSDAYHSFINTVITGETYNIIWSSGMDFTHLAVRSSSYFTKDDFGYVLRFPYFSTRESYEINRLVGTKLMQTYINIGKAPDPKVCNNGDWYNDRTNKLFYLCVSGKNAR